MKRATLGIICILALAVCVSGKTIHVPRDYPTIQDAVDAADPGDKIHVHKGTWSGATVTKAVEIKGIGGAVINDGPWYRPNLPLRFGFFLTSGASGTKISHFTFEGDGTTDKLAFPVFGSATDNVTVEHNTLIMSLQGITNWHGRGWNIRHNELDGLWAFDGGGLGIFLGAYNGTPTNDNKIEHNEIEAHFENPPTAYSVGGLTLMSDHLWGDPGGDIKDNEIKHNKVGVTGNPNTNACELSDLSDDPDGQPPWTYGFDTDEVIENLFEKNDLEESTIPWAFNPDELVGYNTFINNNPQPGGAACGLPTPSARPMPYGPPREGVQVVQRRRATPVTFALRQNNPNPFARETSISYMLPASGHTSLKIYDVSGRVVETLVDTEVEPGIYTVNWDRKDVASGTYFYRLSSNGKTLTKKMTVVR